MAKNEKTRRDPMPGTSRKEMVLLTNPNLALISESRDCERFAALFREVWARMPENVRADLTRAWIGGDGRRDARVELRELPDLGPDVSTDVEDGGRTLRFDATLFDDATPTLVRAGIAFALACAWICVREHTKRLNELLGYVALSIAAQWGFSFSRRDERAIERWTWIRRIAAGRVSNTLAQPGEVYIPAYIATSWDTDGGELTFEPLGAVLARGDRRLAREAVRRAGAEGVAYQRSVRRALRPLLGGQR